MFIKTGLRRASGFTLIEVLIALSVFAIMAMVAYSGLNRMTIAKEHLDAETRHWRDLTLLMGRFEEDISQVAERSWRDSGGTLMPPVRGAAGQIDANGAQLELVRFDGNRMMHVGYRASNGHLDLLMWDALDQAPRTQPQVYRMMDGIDNLSVRFLDSGGQWQLSWPQSTSGPKIERLPRGIELTVTMTGGTAIKRLVALR